MEMERFEERIRYSKRVLWDRRMRRAAATIGPSGAVTIAGCHLEPEEAWELSEFLDQCPPKPRYRITRTFEDPPLFVHVLVGPDGAKASPVYLTNDDDYEEVWE